MTTATKRPAGRSGASRSKGRSASSARSRSRSSTSGRRSSAHRGRRARARAGGGVGRERTGVMATMGAVVASSRHRPLGRGAGHHGCPRRGRLLRRRPLPRPAGHGARVAVGDLLGWGRFLVPLVAVAIGLLLLVGYRVGDDETRTHPRTGPGGHRRVARPSGRGRAGRPGRGLPHLRASTASALVGRRVARGAGRQPAPVGPRWIRGHRGAGGPGRGGHGPVHRGVDPVGYRRHRRSRPVVGGGGPGADRTRRRRGGRGRVDDEDEPTDPFGRRVAPAAAPWPRWSTDDEDEDEDEDDPKRTNARTTPERPSRSRPCCRRPPPARPGARRSR